MAGRIPAHFIDEILTRSDVVDVIQRFVTLKKSGHEYAACCPFHGEKTPSFYVSPQKQFYHCFGCGAHGTAIGFLMEHENLTFPEAIEQLADWLGVEVPRESLSGDSETSDHTQTLLAALDAADQLYRGRLRTSKPAIEYLQNRGIRGETARDYGIGWAPPEGDWLLRQLRDRFPGDLLVQAGLAVKRDDGRVSDRFRGRILFPIRDRRGRTTGFGGRLIAAGEPKYLNSPESPIFHKSQSIYGLFEARRAEPRLQHLVVTEGYMDVVSLAEAGFRQAVACMGTALTASHLNLLFRLVKQITLCFDGDSAGRRAALRAIEQVLPLVGGERQVQVLFLENGDDPDSLVRRDGLEGWLAKMSHSQTLSSALLELLSAQHDLAAAEGRSSLVHAVAPLIASIEDPVYREQWIALIAATTMTSVERVAAIVPETRTEPGEARSRGIRQANLDNRADANTRAELANTREESNAADPGSLKPLWSALLARILQFPQMDWSDAKLEELANANGQAAATLQQILVRLRNHPDSTAAQILESFRETPLFQRLHALSGLRIPEQDPEILRQVALDSARQILREIHRKRLLDLTRKTSGLEQEEISELRRLQSILSRP